MRSASDRTLNQLSIAVEFSSAHSLSSAPPSSSLKLCEALAVFVWLATYGVEGSSCHLFESVFVVGQVVEPSVESLSCESTSSVFGYVRELRPRPRPVSSS